MFKCDVCQQQEAIYQSIINEEDRLFLCEKCKEELDEVNEAANKLLSEGRQKDAEEMVANIVNRYSKKAQDEGEEDVFSEIAPFNPRRHVRHGKQKESRSLLKKYGVNLNEQAQQGKVDGIIGRDAEISRLSEVLSRRTKNNPVLIGEAGVGKTAIAEGLALQIEMGDVPMALKNKQIIRLDVASLVQGTAFRGQFEEKMQALIKEVASLKDTILFVDEMHLLVGAGTGSKENKGMDASNLLKPALARGDFQMIGATTTDEYREVEKDPALARRFQPVLVKEPTEEDSVQILLGIRPIYEEYHQVQYSDETLKAATVLSKRYIKDRFLPDKAIDLMDEAGAKKKQTRRDESEVLVITQEDIAQLVEAKTGIPVQKMAKDESEQLAKLEITIAQQVIGQDEAIQRVAQAIRRNRMGFRKKTSPIGSFLFVGPTGVGKTEFAKVLSEELFGSRDAHVRLDMSEYMESHSVSRLIGAPPGYVGHDEAGQLTEAVRRNPYNLILVDEIEKAHPDVMNIFLQILDDGRLTDNKGQTISFEDTLIVMTSNAGSQGTKEKTVGFGAYQNKKEEKDIVEGLKNYFRPEFLNRLDGVIEFNSLTKSHLTDIVKLMLADTYETMEEHDVELTIDDYVIDYIVDAGYDPSMGARPMRRTIARLVEDKLATFYMQHPNITSIYLTVKDDDIVAMESLEVDYQAFEII